MNHIIRLAEFLHFSLLQKVQYVKYSVYCMNQKDYHTNRETRGSDPLLIYYP